jgi:hypothetical protein
MKQRRSDPQINTHMNERRRELYPAKRQHGQKDYYAKLREKHFFVWRARLWSARYSERVTALELLYTYMEAYRQHCLQVGLGT